MEFAYAKIDKVKFREVLLKKTYPPVMRNLVRELKGLRHGSDREINLQLIWQRVKNISVEFTTPASMTDDRNIIESTGYYGRENTYFIAY